ncbi:MAG: hypothetical protein ACYTFY_02355 [Planctomycetota bacterium]
MIDWSGLDEVDTFDKIFRNALAVKASQIIISPDNRGASVYFSSDEDLQVFDHLPLKNFTALLRYAKHISGIDPYKDPPLEGMCIITKDDSEHTLSMRISKGFVGEEILISIY